MWDLICRILWAAIVIVNVVTGYVALGEKTSRFDTMFVSTSFFVWGFGVLYMLQYAILGEI